MATISQETVTSVPFFNYQKAFADQEEAFVEIFRDVLNRGAFIMQKDLVEFEERLANYLGVKHAIGVANATDALILAWRAAGLPQGAEVIFPSHTMVASPASVVTAGGVPVPVDMGDDGLIDADCVAAAITDKTWGIMPVQLNGRTANMDRIVDMAEKHNLTIIEDSAQGLGSKYKGQFAGTFGKAGVFSFYPAKILGCMGDGGAVITNDDEIARIIKLYRDHGRNHDGDVELWGLNSRLDNLQAALLDVQFKDYQSIIDKRRSVAAQYQKGLGDLAEVTLPPAPDAHPDHYDTYQNYEIQADKRDELKTFLRANGIGTLIQWGGKAVHQFPHLNFNVSLPRTEKFFDRCIMLPMNITLSDAEVSYVIGKIRAFYGR
ncbi:MAG: DegT/DnrJ/EryC1/StrS family aminotransferase [Armatimonadetes bacterium]|nr:DegT/DnrJ/EryC1/StrS family aminotransferase [Armatimonadota bacterium]